MERVFGRAVAGLAAATVAAAALAGCSMDEESAGGGSMAAAPGPSPGVGQSGAQDFGQFRAIVEAGGIPSPDTLDDVGFFAEHKLELPPATCGQDVCIQGLFGVMGNMLTGSNCSTVLVGLNTPLDPATMSRPPLNLALAVDVSGSMGGDSILFLRRGLRRMLPELQPDDVITLVTYSDLAVVELDGVPGDDPGLAAAVERLEPGGSTNIYDGLRTAFDAVERHRDPARQNRVILLSDGMATAGITARPRMVHLAEVNAEAGLNLSTIGVGREFDVELMRSLAEVGAGSFYFLEDAGAVEEVFLEEVQTFLVPLAEDAHLSFTGGAGYRVRAVYGTKLAEADGISRADIDIPALFLAHRRTASDDTAGRRGGGGGILLELLPAGTGPGEADAHLVGTLFLDYRVPGTQERRTQTVELRSPLLPGETPEDGHFDGDSVEKAFVMLNLFVGLKMAAEFAAAGDGSGALLVLEALAPNVEGWLATAPDPDIEDDLRILRLFADNLRRQGAAEPPPERTVGEPWPRD